MKDGKYREALGKWEAALNIMPERAILHEQKAQVLLEIGDAWSALKAATRMYNCCSHLFLFDLCIQVSIIIQIDAYGWASLDFNILRVFLDRCY